MVACSLHRVQELVTSGTYRDLMYKIKSIANIDVEPTHEGVLVDLDLSRIARAKIEFGEILRAFSESGEQIISYSVAKFDFYSGDDESDGEYPPGEEPGPHDRSKTVSASTYSQGFLLANTIEYILGTDSRERLLEYLRLSRIPHAKKYADQVLGLLNVHGGEEVE